MTLQPGGQLLHYRLVEQIGEGGMGVVWKAIDTALDREVAIKVLPAAVSEDADRLARFEREAKLLASLNHPNIATIHGLHQADTSTGSLRFIAMELVRGEDLSRRLERGPLPLDDALLVARQIAEALEAAHEQGVVHRDLKPANVVVDGEHVQVLDFGLAKALATGPASGSGPGVNLSASPTITSTQTRDGVILGTAAYMSPEQARGKAVDKRADIWSFGCVLFETLTAQAAFAGETISDTLVSVLSGEPDWDALPAAAPPNVRRLLERCLTKDARRRLRDIGEARVVLEDAIAGNGGVEVEEVRTATRGLSPASWTTLAVIGGLLFAAGWLLRPTSTSTDAGKPDLSIRRLTFDEGLEQEPALSPDGNYVAYTTDRAGNLDIEILPIGGGDVTRVTNHPADDAQPRWSPDGTRLAFVSARDHADGLLISAGELGPASAFVSSVGGDIFVTPALGGAATKLIDNGVYPTWAPDGDALAFQSNRDGHWRIWRVGASGGEPVQLTTGQGQLRFDFQPAWSPDGRWIAYGSLAASSLEGSLELVPAEGGDPVKVFEGSALAPAWSADGKSIYFSSSRTAALGVLNLWRIGIDRAGRATSPPQRVTFGVGSDAYASASPDGRRLAFATVQFAPDLWSLELPGGKLTQVTTTDGVEDYPHLNPDGRRLVFQSDRTGTTRLWVKELQTGELQQVLTPGEAHFARWSPDGNRLVYEHREGSNRKAAIQRWGDARPEFIDGEAGKQAVGIQWSPDGTRLAGSSDELWVFAPDGPSSKLADEGAFPTWSPDGEWIAYQKSLGQDRREIWVIPADGGEARVLAGGDVHYSHPQWHPTDADRILVVIDHQDLGIVRASSGELERITDLASSTVLVDYPSWSLDGGTIYFSVSRKRGDLYLIEESDAAPKL